MGMWLCLLAVAMPARADEKGEAKPPPEPLLIPGALDTRPPLERRLLVPPVLLERRGDIETTAVFPFYAERRTPDDHQRFVLPYFWRRGKELNADVAAGLFWWLRGPERLTLIVPPLYTHRDHKTRAYGVPPLFFVGRSDDANYTMLPLLLTFARHDEDSLQQFAGPLWRVHNSQHKWWGLFPLLWGRLGVLESMFVMPPLIFRFTEDGGKKRTSIVPPFYYTVRDEDRGWGLVPFISRVKGPETRKTTIPLALFHLGRVGDRLKLVTPLFAYFDDDEDDGYLAVTPLFQWKRSPKGNTNAVAPFFFQKWDDRDKSKALVVAPFYWHWNDPANDTLIIPPLMGRRYRHGLSRAWWFPLVGRKVNLEEKSDTWWVAPTLEFSRSPDSLSFNIHPLWYFGRGPHKRHSVLMPLYFDFRDDEAKTLKRVASLLYFEFNDGVKQRYKRILFPFYWDFEDRALQKRSRLVFPFYYDFRRGDDNRSTVGFPFYWGFQRGNTQHTVSLNVYHKRVKTKEGRDWKFHFLPLFSVGRSPHGKSWDVLLGLAGYERRGAYRRMKLFWIPINLRKDQSYVPAGGNDNVTKK